MSAPATTIYICSNVRLDSRYEHSIFFADEAAQQEYFMGKVVKTLPQYSYIRRTWELKVEAAMTDAVKWNYLFFHQSGKWFYYFIDTVEYVNDATVKLGLQMDLVQTYLFDADLLPCFIERQHATDDTIGANTTPEGLETGEYIDLLRLDFDELKNLGIFAMSTVNLETLGSTVYGKMLNGTYQRCGTYMCKKSDYVQLGTFFNHMENDDAEKMDGIITMFMFPEALAGLWRESSHNEYSPFYSVINVPDESDAGMPRSPRLEIDAPETLDGGFVPKNNKLYTYPFNFLYCTNNNGGAAVYPYEMFDDVSKPSFIARGSISPDGGVKLIPQKYRGVDESADSALTLTGFPICAWSSDEYKIWLAQNMNQQQTHMEQIRTNMAMTVAGGLVSAVAGIATSNPLMAAGGAAAAVGGLVNGACQTESILAQRSDRSIQPPQARGSVSGNVNINNDCMTFSFYTRTIRREIAEQIDNYFTMYGYKVNRVQRPNIHARQNFTYVKTVGCLIGGNLGNEDRVRLGKIFDSGITFWTNGDQIGNYSLSNTTL